MTTATTTAHDFYESPLAGRYASEGMQRLFSNRKRHETWRRIWVELARASHALGLPVSEAQVAQLAAHVEMTDADFVAAAEEERRRRHDVMAHVHAFGLVAPDAAGIIHLGATSCDITDNADLIIYRDALEHVFASLLQTIRQLAAFARQHAATPTLGYTHYQPAMPTTVGKRATLWLQDFVDDAHNLRRVIDSLPFRGIRGATGTQASFLGLFDGDHGKVRELERRVADAFGFSRIVGVTGQTYPRKLDSTIVEALGGLATSTARFATDMRLLAHERELEEPFAKDQIGSSAMPFKRNPMRCERICSLARSLSALVPNTWGTAQAQWLERTLDDSANRRLTMSEAFLISDALLILTNDVTSGIVVNEAIIAAHLAAELPFLATEPIMMAAVRAGGDRQQLHERLKQMTHVAVAEVKAGRPNDLVARLKADDVFSSLPLDELLDAKNPVHVGRAPQQVEEYLAAEVDPVLEQHKNVKPPAGTVRV